MSFLRNCVFTAVVAAVACAVPAHAHVAHTVEPGETLWSIASASNLTTRALAASNGLPEDAQVQVGSTIQVPSEQEAAAALAGTGASVGSPSDSTASSTIQSNTAPSAPAPAGAYTVRSGDTLSAIAASSGITIGQLAWMNGLDPGAPLLIGTPLKLPTAAPLAAQPSPPPPPSVVPEAAPYATPGRVTASEIGSVAAAHGVSPSLAAAVGWQESGFNNGVVSAANARGVMQILPGTWTWVQQRLATQPLDPNSPLGNVHAGVLYLGQLIRDAGGDQALAVASYYQGSASVRSRGLLPDTQRYVDNVMALSSDFGGP